MDQGHRCKCPTRKDHRRASRIFLPSGTHWQMDVWVEFLRIKRKG